MSFIYRSYHLPMPDPESINADSLNSNFLQLGRSGGRPQRTVHPRRLPVNCETHCVSGDRTHNLRIVSSTRYQCATDCTETTSSTLSRTAAVYSIIQCWGASDRPVGLCVRCVSYELMCFWLHGVVGDAWSTCNWSLTNTTMTRNSVLHCRRVPASDIQRECQSIA